MKTGLIIPCYNEEKRINSEAFISFIKANDDYHLCFVNDGSKDNTLKVLQEMKSQVPDSISIVDVKKNAGKAAAVRAGARYLYTLESIKYIGFIDADLSTDFNDFKDLVKTLKSEDKLVMVFGSRNSGGGNISRNPMRKLFSNVIKKFILLILQLPIRDTQCGAKVFKKNAVPLIYGTDFYTEWLFDLEIFIRLRKYYGKANVMKHICEQPLMRWVHVDDSKLGASDAIKMPIKLMQIWIGYSQIGPMSMSSALQEQTMLFDLKSNSNIAIAA
ncbi:MAG: dolichyl-phosphate beta-glucosyltransferase [Gilvibacter sp.]